MANSMLSGSPARRVKSQSNQNQNSFQHSLSIFSVSKKKKKSLQERKCLVYLDLAPLPCVTVVSACPPLNHLTPVLRRLSLY